MLKYTTIGGGFPALGFGGGAISFYSADEIWDLNGVGVAAFPVDMHGVMVMTSVTKLNLQWEQVEPIRDTVLASREDMHAIFQAYTGCC